jgi:hypothetical protein
LGDEILISYEGEMNYTADYIQRFYTIEKYSSDGTGISTGYLDPMDAIGSLIRVVPKGEIDPGKDYHVATMVRFSTENGERYIVADNATWREPFSSLASIGAPYIGTATLTQPQFQGYREMFEHPVTGGFQPPDEVVFEDDGLPPEKFDLLSPAHEVSTSDNTPEVSWQPPSDIGFGINRYRIYVDGLLNKVVMDNTRTSENLSELPPGTHTWYVVAVDHLGNERRSTSTWTINIEGTSETTDSTSNTSDDGGGATGNDTSDTNDTTTSDASITEEDEESTTETSCSETTDTKEEEKEEKDKEEN